MADLVQRSLPTSAYWCGVEHLVTVRCDFLRDLEGMRSLEQEALQRSTQGGFGWGIAFATMRLASIMAAEGAYDAGLEKLSQALAYPEADLDRYYTYWLAAQTYLKAGHFPEGRTNLENAIADIAAGGSRRYEAELYRLKGECALIAGEGLEAQSAFNSAIAIARRQQAKSYELRATMSLARLMRDTNRRGEARAMLTDIYNWFTEGFDTADLKDAKALLDELA